MIQVAKIDFIFICISFCKIKSNQKIFNSLGGALAKNGSFGFLGWLKCRQKPNVLFVRLAFYTDAQLFANN
ncbi:MAG: hypothetical protein COV50_04380 [Flavobacteriales bacterium CG11_big_fil_rev_8_21_14_0_20_35_7]|nr:MAG: hypothetical protein COV50_04380 [Flavobacteriales bacterium CG11_big_fil_rev_8_21_14_0_20_35_7]